MRKKQIAMIIVFVSCVIGASVCSPTVNEAAKVNLPVKFSNEKILTVTNDLGWAITLSEFRMAVADFEFTIEGETHASLGSFFYDLLIPSAHAHPGHSAGGTVTGELPGNFILDFQKNEKLLGEGVFLEEKYTGANFHFRTTDETDNLNDDNPLLGHTVYLKGNATLDDRTVSFSALLDVPVGTEMIGAVFNLEITEQTEGLLLFQIFTTDPSEGDTMFDGLDFALLDDDNDDVVNIIPGDSAHNILMKTVISHDHYGVNFVTE